LLATDAARAQMIDNAVKLLPAGAAERTDGVDEPAYLLPGLSWGISTPSTRRERLVVPARYLAAGGQDLGEALHLGDAQGAVDIGEDGSCSRGERGKPAAPSSRPWLRMLRQSRAMSSRSVTMIPPSRWLSACWDRRRRRRPHQAAGHGPSSVFGKPFKQFDVLLYN